MKHQNVWTLRIAAPVEKVWAALMTEGRPLPFYFDSVLEGRLEPGGALRYRSADGKVTFIEGEVVAIEAPHRFVHTFRFNDLDEAAGQVTFALRDEAGGTRITVTHDGLGPKHRRRVTSGWTRILGGLQAWVEHGRLPLRARVGNAMMKLLMPLMSTAA